MKYFDNIIFYLQRSGGGSVYWGEMIKRFNLQENVQFIEPAKLSTANIVAKNLSLTNTMHEKNIPLSILRYLPVSVSLKPGSFFHSSYYRFSKDAAIKNMVTVHDFVYERYAGGLKKYIHHSQKAACIRNSKAVVCISQSTRRDLLHFIPSASSKKIKVIYNGVSEKFCMLPGEELMQYRHYTLFSEKKAVLYIGHRTAYKNFYFAVDVVHHLSNDYHFIIAGNPLTPAEKHQLDSKLSKRYTFMGNVSDDELNCIYNLSHCLLYPSSCEGFGIPVLEAFRCGCPVIALNTSSIPEVAGNAALLSDELSAHTFKEKITQVNNDVLRKELQQAGLERAAYFSWDKCFAELNELYDELV